MPIFTSPGLHIMKNSDGCCFKKSQNYDVVFTNYVVVSTNVVVVSTNYDVVLTTPPTFRLARTAFPFRKNSFLCQRERLKG